ncbi:hypothetical protein PIB30_097680 [Stylosanthes scabra]|uniref:Uncharacterized protein n=1 Tax=Stylosanthes scabra TaxID=79078 RepID=A0ABU6ZUY7_9FABA|nr:hypothetical protein [Stylosanthes scabra]
MGLLEKVMQQFGVAKTTPIDVNASAIPEEDDKPSLKMLTDWVIFFDASELTKSFPDNRLGYAAKNVVARVLKSCNISFDVNKSVCAACCIGKSH